MIVYRCTPRVLLGGLAVCAVDDAGLCTSEDLPLAVGALHVPPDLGELFAGLWWLVGLTAGLWLLAIMASLSPSVKPYGGTTSPFCRSAGRCWSKTALVAP